MKQTATEWLYEQLTSTWFDKSSGQHILEQAKEMDKEQKIQAQLDVLYNALNSNNVKLSVEQTITELINETILRTDKRR